MRNYLNVNVDVTCFKEYKSITEIIIINMFANVNEYLNTLKEKDGKKEINKNQLLISFQKVLTDCKIKDGNYKLDYGYNALENLVLLASAIRIKENFTQLVKEYAELFESKEKLSVNICNFNYCHYKEEYINDLNKYVNVINVIK